MNRNGSELVPAWARPTPGEHRWPAAAAVAATICLQLLMPAQVVPEGRYVLPALELAVLVGLVVVNPFRVDRESAVLRTAGLVLTALVAVANGWSVVLLVVDLLTGRPATPGELLGAGGAIWLTNVLAFGLVYWELDRGGPAARAAAVADRTRRVPANDGDRECRSGPAGRPCRGFTGGAHLRRAQRSSGAAGTPAGRAR